MDVKNNYKKQRHNICKAIVCRQLVEGEKNNLMQQELPSIS